jgi:tRNA (guanine-N7-)-methyltransferase
MTDRSMTALDYHATSFSQGRMDFSWEELSEAERRQAYADWKAGKGLIGGDPCRRPGSDRLPDWALNRHFFRTLAMDDERGWNGRRLQVALDSQRPLEVEIGFGRGDFLLDRAVRHSDHLFLGYEVKTKAVHLCLARLERLELTNLWISDDDARFSLPRLLPGGRADAVHILFPDPWWKKQHRVKRLFSPPFVDLLAEILRPGGMLYFKSDVAEYGELVRYLVRSHAAFRDHDSALARLTGEGAQTHREHWCQEHGLPVYRFAFRRETDWSPGPN